MLQAQARGSGDFAAGARRVAFVQRQARSGFVHRRQHRKILMVECQAAGGIQLAPRFFKLSKAQVNQRQLDMNMGQEVRKTDAPCQDQGLAGPRQGLGRFAGQRVALRQVVEVVQALRGVARFAVESNGGLDGGARFVVSAQHVQRHRQAVLHQRFDGFQARFAGMLHALRQILRGQCVLAAQAGRVPQGAQCHHAAGDLGLAGQLLKRAFGQRTGPFALPLPQQQPRLQGLQLGACRCVGVKGLDGLLQQLHGLADLPVHQ